MLGKKSSTPPEPEDRVHLKPIGGIRPGVYLAVSGLIIVLAVLFFVLLYPGIIRPGARVVFTSEPSGAALRVNDVYVGTSPCTLFVPRGEQIIEAALPGFDTARLECAIPSRLFASALFPRRYNLNIRLNAANPAAALALSARDYAAWSFGGEPTAAWQMPLNLSEGVYRAGSAGAAGVSEMDGILAAAARFAVSRASLRDLVRAAVLAGNGGNAPSPLTVTQSLARAAAYFANNAGSAAWLADILPADSAGMLINSAWYQNQLAAFAGVTSGESLAAPPDVTDPALPVNQIRVNGLLFTGVGGGVLAQGEPFPRQRAIDAFMMCITEIPVSAYADFLDDVPQWRPDQRETLDTQGLVTGEYLTDFETTAATGSRVDAGVSSVSWYAANAFCQWLTGKLPGIFSGWEIRLPTEAEWEYAAKSAQKWGGGIYTLDGGAWEWCADPYVPLPFLSAPAQAIAAVGSPQRPVRGGSWLNTAGSVTAETRACLPPEVCSPFVSFRPVIAPRGDAPAGRE